VALAYSIVRAIHPELTKEQLCNPYDRPIGKSHGEYEQIINGLNPLDDFLGNDTSRSTRYESLKANGAASMKELSAQSNLILKGVTNLPGMITVNATVYQQLYSALISAQAGTASQEEFNAIVNALVSTAQLRGNPWEIGLAGIIGQAGNPYHTPETHIRSGLPALFTGKYTWICDLLFEGKDEVTFTNPFKKVLILSGGQCGSSCDTSTRTAYMLAKGIKDIDVDYITFGGKGGTEEQAKAMMSATSFPGGNVNGAAVQDIYGPLFQISFFGYLALRWSGLDGLPGQVENFTMGLPRWPYYNNQLPRFSQSEIYQRTLGANSLPTEYYFIPTDFTLPDYYHDVSGAVQTSWDETEMTRMYLDASKAFSMMGEGHHDTSSGSTLSMKRWQLGLLILLGVCIVCVCVGFIFFLVCNSSSKKRSTGKKKGKKAPPPAAEKEPETVEPLLLPELPPLMPMAAMPMTASYAYAQPTTASYAYAQPATGALV